MPKPPKPLKSVPTQVQLPGGIILKGIPFKIVEYHPNGTPKLFEIQPPDTKGGYEGACTLYAHEDWIRAPVPGKTQG